MTRRAWCSKEIIMYIEAIVFLLKMIAFLVPLVITAIGAVAVFTLFNDTFGLKKSISAIPTVVITFFLLSGSLVYMQWFVDKLF